jgi:hypothetical protein
MVRLLYSWQCFRKNLRVQKRHNGIHQNCQAVDAARLNNRSLYLKNLLVLERLEFFPKRVILLSLSNGWATGIDVQNNHIRVSRYDLLQRPGITALG